jgi:hypothetical protein
MQTNKDEWFKAFEKEYVRRTGMKSFQDGGGAKEEAIKMYYNNASYSVKDAVLQQIEKYDLMDITVN